MSLPPINADVKSNVERSCNCCDNVSFLCCMRKSKSPCHGTDQKVSEVSSKVMPAPSDVVMLTEPPPLIRYNF